MAMSLAKMARALTKGVFMAVQSRGAENSYRLSIQTSVSQDFVCKILPVSATVLKTV